jgi:pyruvate-formate lyase-activating enzyme
MYGYKSPLCPGILKPQQIVLSPQGFGPARNIVAFTGGDLMCKPDFYVKCAELIKSKTKQWLLLETNGYGLTPENLDLYCKAGVDSYWLDIKAYDEDVHKWLTGCTNKWILNLPYEIVKRGFVLEVLTLFIPGVVETKQIQKIAEIVAKVNKEIPFSILAFFPQYNMKNYRPPTTAEMILAYKAIKDAGLKNIRVGNIGVFVKTQKDFDDLFNAIGREGL